MLNRLFGLPPSASRHGVEIDQLLEFCHWFMLVLFVGWFAYYCITIFRFRAGRQKKAIYAGVKSKLSTHLEIGVVIIEAVLLFGFAFPLWAKRTHEFPTPNESPLRLMVSGEQFLWNIHYPGEDGVFGRTSASLISASNYVGLDPEDPAAADDIITRNEFALPVGRPVIIELTAKDVIHNFALHQMRIAQDAIPGMRIPIWFTPVVEGYYEVICGQLCGYGHSTMKGAVEVMPQADFESWLKQKLALQKGT